MVDRGDEKDGGDVVEECGERARNEAQQQHQPPLVPPAADPRP